ncbi:hypothetical protein BJY54_005820 [Streptomyces nodosus]|nr:hypothetical protein [Streptomyces nodosus]
MLLAFRPSPDVVLREVPAVVEVEFARRFVGTLVEAAQVGEEDPQAQRVPRHHVQVDLQPGPAVGQQAQRRAEDLAGGDVRAGVRVALAQQLQLGLGLVGGAFTQIVDGERQARSAEALAALLVEDGPQHAVPLYEGPQGGVETGRIDVMAVEFDIEVRGDAAERLPVLASDPVGVLHRGQRERVRLRFGRRRVERRGRGVEQRRQGGVRRGRGVERGRVRGGGCAAIPSLPEQGRPGTQRRSAREVLEGDRAAPASPGADQGHQHQ